MFEGGQGYAVMGERVPVTRFECGYGISRIPPTVLHFGRAALCSAYVMALHASGVWSVWRYQCSKSAQAQATMDLCILL